MDKSSFSNKVLAQSTLTAINYCRCIICNANESIVYTNFWRKCIVMLFLFHIMYVYSIWSCCESLPEESSFQLPITVLWKEIHHLISLKRTN